MINFRYHVVSIVAVFLALAVGIVMGTTVISESVVGRLERDARDFRDSNGRLRQEADALEQRLASYDRFGSVVVPPLIRERLAGRSVVLVVEDGSPSELVGRVEDALHTAGTDKPARVRLTAAWTLSDPGDRVRLSEALPGLQDGTAVRDLHERAGAALGARLASSSDARTESDLLRVLDRTGFVRLEDVPSGSFPQTGAVVVVVASGEAGSEALTEVMLPSLLRAVAGKRIAAVAEPLDAGASLSERVRGDGALAKTVVTVDHASTWPGELSLVWALRSMIDGAAAAHFGTRRGASAIAPEISA